MTQPPLFDRNDRIAQGERLRDEGMAHAQSAAPPTWREAAERALKFVAEHQASLTSEDVWLTLESWGWPMPREPRALGPMMRQADVTWHWIKATEQFSLSERPSRHRAPIREYASLLFGRRNGQVEQDVFNPF